MYHPLLYAEMHRYQQEVRDRMARRRVHGADPPTKAELARVVTTRRSWWRRMVLAR